MEETRRIFEGGTEQYLKPQMEIVELSGENVIVTSCTPVDAPGYDDWLG